MDESSTPAQTIESSPGPDPMPAPPITVVQPVTPVSDPAIRFRGLGTNFRAKLIGIDDVPDSRGDQMCQESILKLKAAVQASGRHKQKLIINVSLEGIKIVDVMTGEVQHVHPVHRISFIARDLTDRRAFGYVYGAGEGRHQFFGIKTAKAAEDLVLALRDLFQVVYDMKKKEIEEAKGGQMVNGEGENVSHQQTPVAAPRQQVQQQDIQPIYSTPQKKQEGNLFDLEQQLSTIQEGINNIDAIGPWPQDLPTSPDSTAGDQNSSDLFGIANLSDISSLSSDFSCASNIIIDYGHAGGGHQQFERTGSSRSSVSYQGTEQSSAFARSSSQRVANTNRLLSVPDESLNSKPEELKKAWSSERRSHQTITKDTVVINKPPVQQTITKPPVGSQVDLYTKHDKRNGDLSATESEVSDATLKGSLSVQSLPGSEKGSKRHGSGFFSRSKKSTKKSKSRKEKTADKKKHRGDKASGQHSRTASSASESKMAEDIVKPRSVPERQRAESVSSVNSVRSCIVSTTVYNTESVQKSTSRTSLNVVSSNVTEREGDKIQRPLTADSFVVRSSICPRTRPRPKNYEPPIKNDSHHSPSSAKENDEYSLEHANPTSELIQSSEDGSSANAQDHQSSPTSSSAWVASFDDDFEHLSGSKKYETTSSDTVIDPFTGTATTELQTSSAASFDDASWDRTMSAADAQHTTLSPVNPQTFQSATPSPQPFVEDFAADPFSSPFDGDDPFAATQMEDPFVGGLETFGEPFANGEDDPDKTFSLDVKELKQDFEISDQEPNAPTFPPRSDEIMFTLKEQKSNSEAEESMTSGMSTPTQSPEHTGTGNKIDINFPASEPPAIPPRLPPRPPKNPSSVEVSPTMECPNVPPPPLPESLPDVVFDEDFDEEILNEDEFPSSPEVQLLPPEIPKRKTTWSRSSCETEHKSDSQSNSSNAAPAQKTSYADELFDLASPVAQPAPQPGAKLTKEQILSSFGGGSQQQGMFPGQPGMMMMPPQGGMQYNQGFQQQMQGFPQATPPMGVFPSGPSPAIPPRPGAMRPPTSQPLPGGAAQNPFGDSLSSGAPPMLSPVNDSPLQKEAAEESKGRSDPFAGLIPGIGGGGTANKKDMFKNFQMVKPPQPPPRANPPVNTSNGPPAPAPQPASDFENYFLNSVGGVPLTDDAVNNNPAPGKQPNANDPFGFGSGDAGAQVTQPAAGDPFGGNQAFSQPFEFNQGTNNNQSLFG